MRIKSDHKEEVKQIKAAKRNPAAFAPLYDKYYKQIFLFIFKKLKNQAETADLTAQVFLKAMVKLDAYEYRGFPFSSWLYRIASNEVNMFFRKKGKHQHVEVFESDLVTLLRDLEEKEEQAKNAARKAALLEAINELKPDQQYILELRFFQNYSFKEIGEILSIREGNAKVRTYRVLEKLKKALS